MSFRHPRCSLSHTWIRGGDKFYGGLWIPAFAGMTEEAGMTEGTGMTKGEKNSSQ